MINNDAEERRKYKSDVSKLNKVIQEHMKKIRETEEQLKMAYNEIEVLKASSSTEINSQREIEGFKSEIKKKDQEVKQSAR